MILHTRTARLGAAAAFLAFLSGATLASATTPPPTVLIRDNMASFDQLDISGALYPPFQPDTQVEPSIAVNPANPLNAVASFQQSRATQGGANAGNGYATTFNGGQTWIKGNIPKLTTHDGGVWDRSSDPVVAFGPHNVVYQSSLVVDCGGPSDYVTCLNTTNSALTVSVSKDGGLTWSDPVVMQSATTISAQTGFFDDKNWIVVDNGTGPTHHPGRVYVVWDLFNVSEYAYCDSDSLVTGDCSNPMSWSTFPNIGNGNEGFFVHYPGRSIGSYPVVLNNGGLEIVLDDFSLGNYIALTAAGAGTTAWPMPLGFIQQAVAAPQSKNVPEQRTGAGPDSLPSVAVDTSAGLLGTVYVVWPDGRFRSDGHNDAVFIASDPNAGWTSVCPASCPTVHQITNGGTAHLDSYNIMVGVGPSGDLRVAYRQRDESGTQPFTTPMDTYYQVSYDKGVTFSAPLKVDTQSSNDGYCATSSGGCFQGDYNELAPAGPNTYIVRDESYMSYPGEPYNNVNGQFGDCPVLPTSGAPDCHTHQRTWVAVVGPQQNNPQIPESPLVVGLTLAGIAAGTAAFVARRRRAIA